MNAVKVATRHAANDAAQASTTAAVASPTVASPSSLRDFSNGSATPTSAANYSRIGETAMSGVPGW